MEEQRKFLIENLRKQKIIITNQVAEAMLKIPREEFYPKNAMNHAYIDTPYQIGKGQTISAPHMNAMMCEFLQIKKNQRILEIGTGSGYHAALLAELVGNLGEVISIERYEELAIKALVKLKELNYSNIKIICADGSLGYLKEAPYDRILVTAASPEIPPPLLSQLSSNHGILCIPLGKKNEVQELFVIKRDGEFYSKEKKCNVVFVPLIGKYGF